MSMDSADLLSRICSWCRHTYGATPLAPPGQLFTMLASSPDLPTLVEPNQVPRSPRTGATRGLILLHTSPSPYPLVLSQRPASLPPLRPHGAAQTLSKPRDEFPYQTTSSRRRHSSPPEPPFAEREDPDEAPKVTKQAPGALGQATYMPLGSLSGLGLPQTPRR